MATNDDGKKRKPLVNWFSREKQTDYSTKKRGLTEREVTTKTVKAPESVLSKGFEKKVVSEKTIRPSSEKTKDRRVKIGAGIALGGAVIAGAGRAINATIGERKWQENAKKESAAMSSMKSGAYTPSEYATEKSAYNKRVSDAKSKTANDTKRNENIGKALLSALPLGISAGITIGTRKKDVKNTRTVTKKVIPRGK